MASQRIELVIIQYPGREDRFCELPSPSFIASVKAIANEIAKLGGKPPYSLYGHSMGAALAFEISRLLQTSRRRLPEHIFLAACNPPHRRSSAASEQIHLLPNADFLEAITAKYGALPAAIMENRELLEISLGILRWDLGALASATCSEGPPLAVPLSVYGGSHDHCTTPDALAEWAQYTTAACDVVMFEGGHFFHQAGADEVVAETANRLKA